MLHAKHLSAISMTGIALMAFSSCNQDLSVKPDSQQTAFSSQAPLVALAKEGEVSPGIVLASASLNELGGGFYEMQVTLKGKPTEDLKVTTLVEGKEVLPSHTQLRFTGTVHFVDDWQGETAYLNSVYYFGSATTAADFSAMTFTGDADTKPWEWTSSTDIISKPASPMTLLLTGTKSGLVMAKAEILPGPGRSGRGATAVFTPHSKGGPSSWNFHVWTEVVHTTAKAAGNPQGSCAHGRCFCVPGQSGEDCESITQPGGASDSLVADPSELAIAAKTGGHGMCHFGRCFCNPGFKGKSSANLFRKFEPIYSLDTEPTQLKVDRQVYPNICNQVDSTLKLTSLDLYTRTSLDSKTFPLTLAIPRFGSETGDPVLFPSSVTVTKISGCSAPVPPEDNSDIEMLSVDFQDHGAGIGSVVITATYMANTKTPKGLVGKFKGLLGKAKGMAGKAASDSEIGTDSIEIDLSTWPSQTYPGKRGAPDTVRLNGTIIVDGDLLITHAKSSATGSGSILLDFPNPLLKKGGKKNDYNTALANCGWSRSESIPGSSIYRTVPVTITAASSAPFEYGVSIQDDVKRVGAKEPARLVPAKLDLSFLPKAAGNLPFLLLPQTKAGEAIGAPSIVLLPKDTDLQCTSVKQRKTVDKECMLTVHICHF